ncbi:MAG: hypothetical protein ACI39U_01115 [Candidatus Cryptobacteroides sp.]
MKKTLTCLMLTLLAGIFFSCVKNENLVPSASLEVVSVGITSAEIILKTSNLTEYAYATYEDGDIVTDPNVIFKTGTSGSLSNGDNKITVSGIEGDSRYTLAVAFKVSQAQYYEKVLTAELATSSYSEGLTLVNTTYDGFTVHFKRPSSVGKDNVIKYGATSIASYNLCKQTSNIPDAEMLILNDEVFDYWTGDGTVTYNDDNIIKLDENGNPVIMDGEYLEVHDKIAPGEPLVFIAGEFSMGESEYGWGQGYYIPLFDMQGYESEVLSGGSYPGLQASGGTLIEDKYWSGYHDRIFFNARKPEPLDAKLNVGVDPKAVSANISFSPDENVRQYCYIICDDPTYEEILALIDNNEDYLQWFVTSTFAFYNYEADSREEPLEINYAAEAEMQYHILVTAMGNEDGTTQNFQHITFQTTEKMLSAPEVVVTPVKKDELSPYSVCFNVKCPSKDAAYGKYAANYSREFEMTLKKYTYEEIVANGYAFTDDELVLINSDEGLEISFSTIPNETTRFAVLLFNSENTSNTITGNEDSKAVAENTSDEEPAAPPVDSHLFKELLGEWTMTASVTKYDYYQGGEVAAGERSCKITITDKVTYPETLPEEVYALYEGKDKEYVDNLYSEFKEEAESFNTWLKNQNYLLCLGFGYTDDIKKYLPGNGIYKDAYDLFTDPDYSAYDTKSLFINFGPKWFIEIASDGTISVPFNNITMYPMCGWTLKSAQVYMAAYNPDGVLFSNNGETLRFPAEFDSETSTLTVNPIIDSKNKVFYPAAGINYYGGFLHDDCTINSPLKLTKGWTEAE